MDNRIIAVPTQPATVPLTCPALTVADIINVCEFLTDESWIAHEQHFSRHGVHLVCRPANSFSPQRRFLIGTRVGGCYVACWGGGRFGEEDTERTRAFTTLIRAKNAGLLRRGMAVWRTA